MEVTQQVNVIRFEQLPPRELSEGEVIEGDFTEISELPPDPDAEFARALHAAGVRIDSGTAQPEELAAIAIAIQERGIDPEQALTDSQFEAVYRPKKGRDPWS